MSPLQIGAELVFRDLSAGRSANGAHEREFLGRDERLLAEDYAQPKSRKTVERVVGGIAAALACEGEWSRPFYDVRFPPSKEHCQHPLSIKMRLTRRTGLPEPSQSNCHASGLVCQDSVRVGSIWDWVGLLVKERKVAFRTPCQDRRWCRLPHLKVSAFAGMEEV